MLTFSQYLSEVQTYNLWSYSFITEAKQGKNLHLEHLEDEVLNNGIDGTRAAINFLRSLRDMLQGNTTSSVDITVKWDGAPAIFAGVNPDNGKFFVGTKGVFNKDPKLNYTSEDIDANHPSPGLNSKLKVALEHLPKLGITGVLQGDLLFTENDLEEKKIDGKSYITFQPNTIVYAVPKEDSSEIKRAKMGIVWHTTYKGDRLEDMKASFGANVTNLKKTPDVYFSDASFRDTSGTINFTKSETEQMNALLSAAGKKFREFNSPFVKEFIGDSQAILMTKTFNNSKVRAGQQITNTLAHANELVDYIEQRLQKEVDKVKTEKTKLAKTQVKDKYVQYFKNNLDKLKVIFDMQNLLVDAKNLVIKKLENSRGAMDTFIRTENGYQVTAPEGFVAIDKIGNAVKLVNRLEFSQANFNATKNWSK